MIPTEYRGQRKAIKTENPEMVTIPKRDVVKFSRGFRKFHKARNYLTSIYQDRSAIVGEGEE